MLETVMHMMRGKLHDARRNANMLRQADYKHAWEKFLSEDRAVIIYLLALVNVYGSTDQRIEAQGIDNESRFLRFEYQDGRDA